MLSANDLVRHSGFVRGLARQMLDDRALADDVAQDAMVVALERPPQRADNPRGWLRRVVASVASKRMRGERRRRARERAVARPEAIRPDDAVVRLETERRLVEAVLALAEPYRSTVVLRFFDEISVRDVARRQGVPKKTAETRLRRALEQLRGGLGPRWAVALLPLAGFERKAAPLAAGVTAMASKATIAVASFLCGVGTTALYTGMTKPERHDRAPPTRPAETTPREVARESAPPPATKPAEAEKPPVEVAAPADYLRRINEAANVAAAVAVAREIAALPPEAGREVILAIFREIADGSKREKVLGAFAGCPYYLDVLDVGATDADPTVRGAAFLLLRPIALRAFQEDPDAYAAWRARHAGESKDDVFRASAVELVARLRTLDGSALEKELRLIAPPRSGPLTDDALRAAGIPELVEPWILQPLPEEERDPEGYRRAADLMHTAFNWLVAAQPGEAYLRRVVVPILEDAGHRNPEQLTGAALLIGKVRSAWAADALLTGLRRMDLSNFVTFSVGQGLAETGDKRAIPYLIGAIVAHDDYSTVYGLGYFGLTPLTGVAYDKTHGAAWWLQWWDTNKDGLPADVRSLDPRAIAREMKR